MTPTSLFWSQAEQVDYITQNQRWAASELYPDEGVIPIVRHWAFDVPLGREVVSL